MLYDIVTQILNMIIFSSSPRNQLPNHGLRAGDKYYWKPATSTSNSSSVPQVTPPFPSHPIFGMAHPLVLPQYGPFTSTGITVSTTHFLATKLSQPNKMTLVVNSTSFRIPVLVLIPLLILLWVLHTLPVVVILHLFLGRIVGKNT